MNQSTLRRPSEHQRRSCSALLYNVPAGPSRPTPMNERCWTPVCSPNQTTQTSLPTVCTRGPFHSAEPPGLFALDREGPRRLAGRAAKRGPLRKMKTVGIHFLFVAMPSVQVGQAEGGDRRVRRPDPAGDDQEREDGRPAGRHLDQGSFKIYSQFGSIHVGRP